MKKVKNIHIGKRIRAKMKEQGRTNTWLAQQLPCSPNYVYIIYQKTSINTDMLIRISNILDYNFFDDFSK
ncbi:MAG: XRE family transcriptional regulator [Bacteroidales bacterium]|nr:XRE family transcriptional regulator [Bacteroidales bacterium]